MNLKVIAYARNGFTDKFGIPRQSREDSCIETRIVFEPEYSVREALRGIEGFSHLWLLWGFDKVESRKTASLKVESKDAIEGGELSWSPTVRPPRLGGNKRMGVFATRSPFRPNPIGLTSVKLIRVESRKSKVERQTIWELVVTGADLLDGTPIYDIKPYLSFSDSHPEAKNGFAEETQEYQLKVDWGEAEVLSGTPPRGSTSDNLSMLSRCAPVVPPTPPYRELEEILSQDPRPGYQDDPEREYKLDYAGWRVTFVVKELTSEGMNELTNEGVVFVKKVEKVAN